MQYCRYYRNGACIRGNQCSFSHRIYDNLCLYVQKYGKCNNTKCKYSHKINAEICKNFLNGNCNLGNLCPKYHRGKSEDKQYDQQRSSYHQDDLYNSYANNDVDLNQQNYQFRNPLNHHQEQHQAADELADNTTDISRPRQQLEPNQYQQDEIRTQVLNAELENQQPRGHHPHQINASEDSVVEDTNQQMSSPHPHEESNPTSKDETNNNVIQELQSKPATEHQNPKPWWSSWIQNIPHNPFHQIHDENDANKITNDEHQTHLTNLEPTLEDCIPPYCNQHQDIDERMSPQKA